VEIILFGILTRSYLGSRYSAVKLILVALSMGQSSHVKQLTPPSGADPWTPLYVVPGEILHELRTINNNYTEGLHEFHVPGCLGECIVHGCA
jgi:hypothetical protein